MHPSMESPYEMLRCPSSLICVAACWGLGCVQFNPEFEASAGGDELGDGVGDDTGVDPSENPDADTDTGEADTADVDDDDEETDTSDEPEPEPELCEAPTSYFDCDLDGDAPTGDPFRALGIGCPGPAEQTIPGYALEFSPDVNPPESTASWRIVESFGTAPGPHHGDKMWAAREGIAMPSADPREPELAPNTSSAVLMLSTGTLPPPDSSYGVTLAPGAQLGLAENGNPDGLAQPAPISADLGSNDGVGGTPFENCDGINDCSDSLYESWVVEDKDTFFDQLHMKFTVVPPEGVDGYAFDFAYFSSEFPEFLDSIYNDTFVAWSSSELYTGNLTFIGQAPLSATGLADLDAFAHVDDAPALAGTGFEGHGSTEWLLARGPAAPGEPVELTFFLTDIGDAAVATVVLLDNFRWDCGGCMDFACGFVP